MDGHKISLLTSNNYATWKQETMVLLMDRGSWGFITGDEAPLGTDATRRETADYNMRKDRAYSTIFFGVSEEYRDLISSTTSGAKAWEILREQFEPVARCRVAQLLDQFYKVRFTPGDSMGLFLARLKKAVKDMTDAGHPVEERYIAFQAIRYLPGEYQNLVQVIYRWEDKQFKLVEIEKELIQEEHRIKQCQRDIETVNESFSNSVYDTSVIEKLKLKRRIADNW
ncbi:retrovirus-related pol polyprotein from transposon tnt 1-94 [Lasius niger]|uniref:Retrovirus-related pol polyprotein from transposon tnt 1-94 n=1 Tax=Lasius niger TaxID=67767 RepID=A0A0J7JXD4_LASNI|nr:retrovirus-related pol polyprotein from transposon tnt 1-94 [Lasius niger]